MSPVVVAAVIIGALVVIGLATYFSRDARLRRAMKAVPLSTIAGATEGARVRIVGRVLARDRVLRGPLSHRECVAFRVLVETRRQSGKSSHWVKTIDEHQEVDFVLEDETGRARVESRGSDFLIVLDHSDSSGFLNDASPELEAFLSERGHQSTSFLGMNKTMRYREGALETGEQIAVVGLAHWEDDPEAGAIDTGGGGFRDAVRKKRLVLTASEGAALHASDDQATHG
jgi:hypothetical protein